ncbi:probable F-box protein At4g22030 [Arachis duranensis]|uniref:Probable F-box protein At4g22030 n=1 Tax=Arachis duranensis TaxID=130453 RepID=A0A6P4D3X7_ARADU|nr:probable F-box protein At4g22030 [Arachis duranensis]
MSSLQLASSCYCSNIKSKHSSTLSLKRVNCAINVPKASTRKLIVDQGLHKFKETTAPLFEKKNNDNIIKILHDNEDDDDAYHRKSTTTTTDSSEATNTTIRIHELYAVLEAVSDRIEMHNNMKEQRDNWNTLLLNSINMITLTASTMAGVAATTHDGSSVALKLSSALLFTAATGMLLVMNKIQPSQLAEEQRNATRLFKQLHSQIQATIIALVNNNNNNISIEEAVKGAIEKVLALDKAYPLPLLGAMLEKFPSKFEPARWWPNPNNNNNNNSQDKNNNGWNIELEREMREVMEVVKRNDKEEYERLGNLALKMNKGLAISGPLLTGIAALGCVAFLGGDNNGGMVGVVAGAMAAVVNAIEHGGQVGMVFEMYRNCGGFFQQLEERVEATLEENDLNKRENGELFEMNMALQLGRSVSQLRQLASKSYSSRLHATQIDEFASKLF